MPHSVHTSPDHRRGRRRLAAGPDSVAETTARLRELEARQERNFVQNAWRGSGSGPAGEPRTPSDDEEEDSDGEQEYSPMSGRPRGWEDNDPNGYRTHGNGVNGHHANGTTPDRYSVRPPTNRVQMGQDERFIPLARTHSHEEALAASRARINPYIGDDGLPLVSRFSFSSTDADEPQDGASDNAEQTSRRSSITDSPTNRRRRDGRPDDFRRPEGRERRP